MVQWRQRPLGYKLGFFGLILGNLSYVIAFSVPHWSLLHLKAYGLMDQTVGLWQACIDQSSTCISNVHESNPAWLNAVRVTCSIALILFVMSLWCGCHRNFTRLGQERCQSPGRRVEGVSVMGCLLGATGSIIFAFQFHAQYVSREKIGCLHWGYALLLVSLAVSSLSAGFMFFFNRSCFHRPRPRGLTTLRLRGMNGLPVAVQLYAGVGDDRLHIPYFGEISRDQLTRGAVPMQPPSYELATGVGDYGGPPRDMADAPPLYEDIGKDGALPSRAEEEEDSQQVEIKAEEGGSESPRDPSSEGQ